MSNPFVNSLSNRFIQIKYLLESVGVEERKFFAINVCTLCQMKEVDHLFRKEVGPMLINKVSIHEVGIKKLMGFFIHTVESEDCIQCQSK